MKDVIISEILKQVLFNDFIGNKNEIIEKVIQINPNNKEPHILSWCSNKNKHLLKEVNIGTIIISTEIEKHFLNSECNYIIVKNPRRTFQEVLTKFFVKKIMPAKALSASIHGTVKIGLNVFIGENVVIEANCVIGNNCVIQHNTVLFEGCILGDNIVIGSNNTIGGIGFGYEKDIEGNFVLIPHLGNVILGDNVEIGNNTTIDRAVLGSTILSDNVKVDNLVHIAHGVQIGENSVVIANSMVAGSVVIGKNTWVAPSSSIMNQKSVGNNSIIGMGAVVLKDVGSSEVVAGNPSKLLKKL